MIKVACPRILSNLPPQSPRKSKTPEKKSKIPGILLVNKEEQNFTEESGAKVVEGPEGITIYVNRNNKYLEDILRREPNDRKDYYEDAFKNAVGLQTFALYDKLKDNEESNCEQASSAIAIIQATGKEICQY
jgi:hypothetical protein